jgi:4-amino-4-deoxy-L-arabinose transferase-like glycosyltransferase
MSNPKSQRALGWVGHLKFEIGHLIFAFLVLGLIYTVTVPLFEAPDEPWHFSYIRYVAEGHGLPSLLNNDSGAYQEVGQPPLYYLVAALVTAPVRADDLRGMMWHNPGFGYHAPGTVNDNKNLLIHTDREAFPPHGAALAIHLARLVSLAFGALTVLATWGLAQEVFPNSASIPLLAAALVALTPQFVFMSSVASNDSSAAALSTATLWAIARMWRLGVTVRRAALTGLLVGLASLTKTSTVLLGVFAAVAVLFRLQTAHGGPRSVVGGRWSHAVVLTAVALAVGGWWYARNGWLYGDPLGLSAHLNTPWARPAPVSLSSVLPTLPMVYRSFWGAFGWGNVEMSPLIYYAIATVLIASMIGWIVPEPSDGRASQAQNLTSEARNREFAILLMCVLWCGAVLASLLRWNQQVEAPHGRLLFPVIGAFALLLVGGLARLPRPHTVLGIVVTGFLLLSLAAPFVYIQPAYAQPELFPLQVISSRGPAVSGRNLLYGTQAWLIGFALDRPSVSAGEWLNVTLCWTAARAMTGNYAVFIHLLGRENLVVGARTTYPGLGRFPTSLWPVGRAFCDTIPVRVEAWTPVPELYAIEVGLHDPKTDDRLEAADASSGQIVAPPVVGRIRVAPLQPLHVAPQRATQADFDPAVLIGFDAPDQARPGELLLLRLYWRAVAALPRDYTVFVHLLDGTGRLVAQADSEPRNGAYPTSAWVAGDVIPDDHVLSLPADLVPGDYTLSVGLYLAPDGPRRPLTSQSGDAFALGTLRVTR